MRDKRRWRRERKQGREEESQDTEKMKKTKYVRDNLYVIITDTSNHIIIIIIFNSVY